MLIQDLHFVTSLAWEPPGRACLVRATWVALARDRLWGRLLRILPCLLALPGDLKVPGDTPCVFGLVLGIAWFGQVELDGSRHGFHFEFASSPDLRDAYACQSLICNRASASGVRRIPEQMNFDLLSDLDWRTREGRFLVAVRRDLTAHIGGKPNLVQRQLIERAARLTLYVELLDARSLAAGSMSDHDQKQYLAWSNSLVRLLKTLGIKGAGAAPVRSLSDIVGGGDA
jgi:hypothetical protein